MAKISFAPQELLSLILGTATKIGLTAAGLPLSHVTNVVDVVVATVKGMDMGEQSASDILSPLSEIAQELLSSKDLPDSIKTELSRLFQPQELISLICNPSSTSQLEWDFLRICANDPNSLYRTLPLNEISSEIRNQFYSKIVSNPALANHLSSCKILFGGTQPIHNANSRYAKSFLEPMFLHNEDLISRVTLENLFVVPKTNSGDIITKLSQFTHSGTPFLFLNGDAGTGKTTVIAYLNYLHLIEDQTANNIFDSRPIITIRLRDLNKAHLGKDHDLATAICQYTNIANLDQMSRLFPNAILLLDGFDELCMIEGLEDDHDILLYRFADQLPIGYQCIVTTRPEYISKDIKIPNRSLSLSHFDKGQRDEWIDRYTSDKYCGQYLSKEVLQYIQKIDKNHISGICDTPMSLYMLAGRPDASKYMQNDWSLYHYIFGSALSKTEYNAMIRDPNRKYAHGIVELQEALYRVSEELAFRMYQFKGKQFFLDDGDLEEIIKQLSNDLPILKKAEMRTIAEKCHGLCCYWKSSDCDAKSCNEGAIEFRHNNIRDFFLAEKIYREMNAVYKRTLRIDEKEHPTKIAKTLAKLFPYGVLPEQTVVFLYLRSKLPKDRNEFDFGIREYAKKYLPSIITALSEDVLYTERVLAVNHRLQHLNPIQRIDNVLICTMQLYRCILEPHLSKRVHIRWVKKGFEHRTILGPNISRLLKMSIQLPDKKPISLGDNCDFSGLNLSKWNFHGLVLTGTNFANCDLSRADFSDTNLSGAHFENAKLCRANFRKSNLKKAILLGSDLSYADLRDTELAGTRLPDNSCNTDNKIIIRHLRSSNIKGLKI